MIGEWIPSLLCSLALYFYFILLLNFSFIRFLTVEEWKYPLFYVVKLVVFTLFYRLTYLLLWFSKNHIFIFNFVYKKSQSIRYLPGRTEILVYHTPLTWCSCFLTIQSYKACGLERVSARKEGLPSHRALGVNRWRRDSREVKLPGIVENSTSANLTHT